MNDTYEAHMMHMAGLGDDYPIDDLLSRDEIPLPSEEEAAELSIFAGRELTPRQAVEFRRRVQVDASVREALGK